ncbi:ABC transporter ATP-binding protein [Gordonia zhaorongruii]|uniref:ABC transporter ATP-binding protein n=1 Tax=Gordonia zhaorongruii TaxID=2597659 RepID=UPI003CC82C02
MTFRQAIARYGALVRRHRRALVIAGLLFIIAAMCDAVGVFVLSDVVDGALTSSSWISMVPLGAAWIGVTAVSSLADYRGQLIAARASESIVLSMRDRLFAHVQHLSPLAHRRRGIGDLVVRHSGDIEAVEHLISSGLLSGVVAAANVLAVLVAAIWMSPIVTLVAVASVPPLWAMSAWYGRRQTDSTWRERTADSTLTDTLHAALTGHAVTVAYNQQPVEQRQLAARGREWMDARIAVTRVEAGFGAALGFAQVVVALAVAIAGVWQVRSGALSVGQLLALTGYLSMLYPKVQELADVRLSLAATAVSAARIGELMDEPAHAPDRPDAVDHTGPATAVAVEGVSLVHGTNTVLDGAHLSLPPGRVTALIGPSGSGKSSLAALLTRLDDPSGGRITIDGLDIAGLTATSVRDRITLLPQSPVIKPGTVAENIAYGRPDATRSAVTAAAEAAGATDFVSALPDGFDTPLSGDGLELSGGQRQRLCVARALLRDTPVLVLDEPTSALDDQTVADLIPALRRLAANRTTLLITHDSRILPLADSVVALRAGRIEDADRVMHDRAEVEDAVPLGHARDERVVHVVGSDVADDRSVEVDAEHPDGLLGSGSDALGSPRQDLASSRRKFEQSFEDAVAG